MYRKTVISEVDRQTAITKRRKWRSHGPREAAKRYAEARKNAELLRELNRIRREADLAASNERYEKYLAQLEACWTTPEAPVLDHNLPLALVPVFGVATLVALGFMAFSGIIR